MTFADDLHHAMAAARQAAAYASATAVQPGDWDGALDAWRMVLRQQGFGRLGGESRAALFDLAATTALHRARLGGQEAVPDTQTAVGLYQDALDAADPASPLRPNYANNLGVALRDLAELSGDPAALDQSIDVLRWTARDAPPDAPARTRIVHQLGVSLRARYALRHVRDDLIESVATLRDEATAADSEDSAARVDDHAALGNALVQMFSITEDRGDLDEGIQHLECAISGYQPDDADLPGATSNLASARLVRYDAGGPPDDLAEAVRLLADAITRASQHGRPSMALFSNLGNALSRRSALTADRTDADLAVGWLRQAAELAAGTTRLPAVLGNLAAALLERFDLTGQIDDMDEAIGLLDAALAGTAGDDPDAAGRLNNLAIALRRRQLRRQGGRDDLDRAVAALERARALTVTGRDEDAIIADLGIALHQRFDVSGDMADLDRAVECLGEAVERTLAGSPDEPLYLNNLGATLAARAAHTADLGDLCRAVDVGRQAVAASTSLVYRIGALVNLGNGLSELFDRRKAPADRAAARHAYRTAARDGLLTNASDALSAARNWSEWAAGRRAWREVIEAHGFGSRAAHRLFEAQAARADQEAWLRDADGLAALGAFAHARRGELAEAALALEGGRATITAQILDLGRADIETLDLTRPDLRQRYSMALAEWRRQTTT